MSSRALCLMAHIAMAPALSAFDDPEIPIFEIPIFAIQGASHHSPFVGVTVTTSGLITAVTEDGFFLQDPLGDGDELTSDAIYVYTKGTPTVKSGDQVEVTGKVIEFTPGGQRSGNLSLTEIALPEDIHVLSTGNPLPHPSIIGRGGRPAPTRIIDDDRFAVFDPHEDGIDFYESLEAMRVTVEDAVAVSPTSRFGEVYAVSNRGQLATGMNSRGGITVSEGDFNPERIQLDGCLLDDPMPVVNTGDVLGDVTGVMGYDYGNFEILAEDLPRVTPAELAPEVTFLSGDETHLTIASYNVQNLDPGDPPERFRRLGEHIAWNLNSPDIVALQEVQDNSGPTNNGVTVADLTASLLTNAILKAGGPAYDYYDLAPIDNTSGGEPGGNIRVAYLVNPGRVALVPGSLRALDDTGFDTFDRSRNPLEATIVHNDNEIVLINCHLSSRVGSGPLFGSRQPSPVSGGQNRKTQAIFLKNHVGVLLERDPEACVVVLGDLNDDEFSEPLKILTEDPPLLLNLNTSLSAVERYSQSYQGNAQMIDHILVSAVVPSAALDAVHVNVGFADQSSDHDPLLARIAVGLRRIRDQTPGSISSAGLDLSQNAPNPFTTSTSLSYHMPRSGFVQLEIFNTAGQLVRTLVNDHRTSGRHQIAWKAVDQNGRPVSNGIYNCQLRTAQTILTMRMALMR